MEVKKSDIDNYQQITTRKRNQRTQTSAMNTIHLTIRQVEQSYICDIIKKNESDVGVIVF